MFTFTLSNYFGRPGEKCCDQSWIISMDQLTAVKTRYPLTSITWPYRGLRCRPIEVEYLFEVIRWQVTSFQMIAGSSLIFFKFIWNMLCLCAAQLKFWFQTDLGRENSASYYRPGRQLLMTLLTMVMRWSRSTSIFYALIGQNLTGEFMRKIYAASLAYFDSWSWQSFVSTCDVFNCLFPLNVQNEIQLLSRVFCYSWLVCLLVFWLRDVSLVKVRNLILDGMVFIFHLAWCKRGFKSLKWFWPYLIAFRSCILKIGKPE